MRALPGIAVLLGLLPLLCGCDQSAYAETARTTDPATIRLALPAGLGDPERPAVEFDHQVHTRALDQEGCAACHPGNSERQLLPRFNLKKDPSDADDWMELYHQACLGCHEEQLQAGKPAGPDDCGQCHLRRRTPWRDVSRQMRFDYSLHYRHVRASDESCDECHHVYDEKQQELVYQPGAEDACGACHRPAAAKGETSLGDAVHTACVNCHIERQEKGGPTGPRQCAGCHGAGVQARLLRLKDVPRPERGQPEATWIASPGATYGAVPFDHKLHEGQVDSCSACHHQSLGKCGDCHKQLPGIEDEGTTLQQAFHALDSTLSCVGCHQQRSGHGECAGCHYALPVPPGQAACDRCHVGPPPEGVDPDSFLVQAMAPPELAELPAASPDFPEALELELLADKYGPARFSHRKIVAALDRAVRGNRLAVRFHQGIETLCSGCHHNSPPGEPVPACRSCHGEENVPGKDLPGLGAAYHRQCIGCHRAIGHQAQGCTDCHEELRK